MSPECPISTPSAATRDNGIGGPLTSSPPTKLPLCNSTAGLMPLLDHRDVAVDTNFVELGGARPLVIGNQGRVRLPQHRLTWPLMGQAIPEKGVAFSPARV